MNNITLYSPFDVHLHLRQGEMLKQVAPLSAKTFAGAIIMPNTDPPRDSLGRVVEYIHEVYNNIDVKESFAACFTLYFRNDYTYQELEKAKDYVKAIKFYPKNLTTNSQYGCDPNDLRVHGVLGCMEELEIPLCIHAEAPGYHEDREYNFHKYIKSWSNLYPRLKIIIEHISDARTIKLLKDYENIYGTITAHHLLLTGDDFIGPPLNVHNFCMPVCKRPEDREALQQLVLSGPDNPIFNKIMFGSDSAPHNKNNKEQNGCAGIFTAPIALQLLAELFLEPTFTSITLNKLQMFISNNAQKIYNIELPYKEVNLVRKLFNIPHSYNLVIPMWAGRELSWSIK